MQGDKLAKGGRSAQFPAANTDVNAPIELLNVSSEPREEFIPIEIDRTRKVKRLVPKGDQILVQRREAENISAGGIIIADETKEKDRPAEGVILEVGPKVKDLKKGEHIIFGLYAGTEYPWGAEKLLFMREEEVISGVED